ncbi:MAG: hypothetical protein JW908_07360 [Anaerolineales bacterium]|nr:hypothetical protein [Anaerolineales bacterium]
MNQIIEWLSIGDLRSDGQANEAAAAVLSQPAIFPDLLAALTDDNDVVRGHAADALEKVSREMPDLLVPQLAHLIRVARTDNLPMVRFHLAMIFGNLAHEPRLGESIIPALLGMLQDESAFVKSWSLSSLVLWGRQQPHWQQQILDTFSTLTHDTSIAVRHRAVKAIQLLTDNQLPIPSGWVKSKRV